MPGRDIDQRIAAVRKFTRFYTKQFGALREGLLNTAFPLPQARVLYELGTRTEPTATDLAQELAMDAGYLSRILRNFEKRGLIRRVRAQRDKRQTLLSLTRTGRTAFADINKRSYDETGEFLRRLSAADQVRLVGAMQTVQRLLGGVDERREPFILRPHRIGDIGWVIQRHGTLYAEEFGWDEQFEPMVAEIAAKFVKNFGPKRERCWIAEMDGENVGSVFLVRQSDTVAKLRLLLVDPKARGLGLGGRLVDECARFARQAGYRKITLWTNDVLKAARAIYQRAGYKLVHEEPHHSFGKDLVGETWELKL